MNSSAYWSAITASDETLQARQHEIRAAEDAGEVTVQESAQMRCTALAGHLARCKQARQRYLQPDILDGLDQRQVQEFLADSDYTDWTETACAR